VTEAPIEDYMMSDMLVPLLLLLVPVLYLGSIVWVMFDAERRDRSGCLLGLLVAATGPFGLLIWLVARPTKEKRR